MEDITVIKATPEDAEGIQRVLYETWLATYPNEESGITAEDIEAKFPDKLTGEGLQKRVEQLRDAPENITTLVAKDGQRIVGVCRIERKETRNEQGMFYVLPEYQRRGIGTALWNEIQKYADVAKDTYVSVASYNHGAIDFYTSVGFSPTDEQVENREIKMKSGAVMPQRWLVRRAR